MTNPNDPAFVGIVDNTLQYVPGMTKREYFAGLAMTRLAEDHENRNTHWEADLAYNAVRVADALIAELSK